MKHAMDLARRGLGITWPNPSVGCVIVKYGVVIGRGVTGRGGRPHAEVQAIKQAGVQTRGATLYVTLEPCAHHGHTAPCADAIVESGIDRVVVAICDVDARVSGKGIEILKQSNVQVDVGVLEQNAAQLHQGFFNRLTRGRPYITLKIATTHDGYTTMPVEMGRWITGEAARAHTHLERSMHDAVLAGVNTILADDPMLNARVPGFNHSTVRIVLDGHTRTPFESHVVRSKDVHPLWVIDNTDVNTRHLESVCAHIAAKGINRILVEGGVTVIRSFLEADMWDRFLWYRAPISVGSGQVADRYCLNVEDVTHKSHGALCQIKDIGKDILEIYTKTP